METIVDKVFIKVNTKEASEKQIQGTDKTLHLLTHFREYEDDVCTQSGIVVAIPRRLSNKGEIKIKPGDKIYTHHLLTHHENDASNIAPNTFVQLYRDIYCRIVDGEIQVLSNWNLLEPVNESQKIGNFLVNPNTDKKVTGLGIMRYPSEGMIKRGIKPGDKIEFKRNAGYIILVEGVKYYNIPDNFILMAHGTK